MTIPFSPVARSASGSTSGEKADMARLGRRSRQTRCGGVVSPEEAGQVAWDHVAAPAATAAASGAPGQSAAGGGAAMNRTPGNSRKWAS